jgi:integrase/recombinase XerD
MIEDMQMRNFSPHTQASYVQQVSLFARHFSKPPEVLGLRTSLFFGYQLLPTDLVPPNSLITV